MSTDRRCDYHQMIATQVGDALVETVEGPVARLTEWGKQQGQFHDGCPGTWAAHYSLLYKDQFIAGTSTPSTFQANLLREIALALNRGAIGTKGEDDD